MAEAYVGTCSEGIPCLDVSALFIDIASKGGALISAYLVK